MSSPLRLVVSCIRLRYSVRLLAALKPLPMETHPVMPRAAEVALADETDLKVTDVRRLADVAYRIDDLAAAVSSGCFRTIGMVVVPCSMRSGGEIAHDITSNLLTRAADVVLKERRKLILVARETPLHTFHPSSMMTPVDMSAVIAPPVPAFFSWPCPLARHLLDLFDLDIGR